MAVRMWNGLNSDNPVFMQGERQNDDVLLCKQCKTKIIFGMIVQIKLRYGQHADKHVLNYHEKCFKEIAGDTFFEDNQ